MATPDIIDNPVPSLKPRSKSLLVWMIISQILSVLLILTTIASGFFLSLLSSGWIFLIIALAIAILLIIPIVYSWKMYKKDKTKAAVALTTIPFVLLACPWTVIAIFSYLNP